MPIFANIQAAEFYPPVIAATAMAAWTGDQFLPRLLAASVVLQVIFAGLCAFWLMRRLHVRPAAAWIGATVFELGCFFAAQPEHMGAMQGAVWLPLIWLSVLMLEPFRRRWLALLVLSLAMTVLAGLPQVAFAAFASAVWVALLLVLFRLHSPRTLVLAGLACLWALVAAAIQFIPTVELTRNSVAKYRTEWLGTGGGIAPGALLSLVIPNYWNVFDLAKFHGPTDLTFLYLYSSLLGLTLALGAMIWKPDKRALAFGTLLLLSTFSMLGGQTAAGRFVLRSLPDFIQIGIHPEFLFCVFSLALSVLAGLGAERLLRTSRLQILAGIIIACDLLFMSSGRPMNEQIMQDEPWIRSGGSSDLLAKLREITGRSSPPGRYDAGSGGSFLWSSIGPLVGLPTGNGCDPLAPERVIDARLAFAAGPRWGTCYQVERPGSPVMNLMNTRALLSRTEIEMPGLRFMGVADGYRIYENLNSLPRFFIPERVRSVGSLAEAAVVIRAPGFRPLEDAVVEAPREEWRLEPVRGGVVRVVSYSPTAIRLETEASASSLLVASDLYYPGWQADVDGRSVRIYATDAAFRGVRVPSGKHVIDFRFVPRILYFSAGISMVAIIGILILCIV